MTNKGLDRIINLPRTLRKRWGEIDYKLLDRQSVALERAIDNASTEKDKELLEGLSNLLAYLRVNVL